MRQFVKFVASVLLVVVGAIPVLAAVPCRQTAKVAMQCGPDCPMMAKATSSRSIEKIGADSARPSCCKMHSHSSAPVSTQRAPERPIEIAFAHSGFNSVLVPFVQSMEDEDVISATPRGTPSSQAILCTFLI